MTNITLQRGVSFFTLAGQCMSILHSVNTCLAFQGYGTFGESCRHRSHPARESVFFFGTKSLVRFWELVVWMLCIGRARHPGPTKKPHANGDLGRRIGIEVLNVGGWLTHGDAALETDCDFLLITETRLIPARYTNECAQLRKK